MCCHAHAHVACNWPTELHADARERESKVWAQYLHVMLLGQMELKMAQSVLEAMDLTYVA